MPASVGPERIEHERSAARSPRGRAANVGLAVASTALTLLVVIVVYEIAARVRYERWRRRLDAVSWLGTLTVASSNPVLLWEYRPYADADGVATNRWGFRDADYGTRAKPAGVRRVAFVGDSVTLGMGVEPEETFVRLVGAAASAPGRPVQALNFGVDGYNALQIRELLTAKVLAFEPDEVVYVMCLNDFDFTDSSGRKIAYFRPPLLFFPQEIERRWRALRGIEYHHWHFRKNEAAVFRAVTSMRDVVVARGASFLVATVPVFPKDEPSASWFERYPLADLDAEIGAFCRAEGIRFHDLVLDFRRRGEPPERCALDVWHLSVEGHRIAAAGLLPLLKSGAGGGEPR